MNPSICSISAAIVRALERISSVCGSSFQIVVMPKALGLVFWSDVSLVQGCAGGKAVELLSGFGCVCPFRLVEHKV